jgi:hypothetical protein
MDRDEARRLLLDARREQAEAERIVQEQRARMNGMRSIVSGVLQMFPDLEDEAVGDNETAEITPLPEDRPRGAEAVRAVLMDTPGKWFSVPMVVHALDHRGWLPESDAPSNAVRTALERLIATEAELFRKDRGEKTGKVVYAYKPPSAPAEEGA